MADLVLWPSDRGTPTPGADLEAKVLLTIGKEPETARHIPTIHVYAKRNEKSDELDLIQRFYVNCGTWTASRTDFAVVWGNEILQGTWAAYKNEGARPPSPSATRLLDRLFKNAPPERMFMTKHRVSLQEFLPRNEGLWVFIGDCHIHALRRWSCDNFTHAIDPAAVWTQDGVVSCAGELRDFVRYLDQHVAPRKVVQIGDMYEVWEVQGLIECAFGVMEDINVGLPEGQMSESKKWDAWLERERTHKVRPKVEDPTDVRSWQKKPFPVESLARPDEYRRISNAAGGPDGWKKTRQCLLQYFGLTKVDVAGLASEWLRNVTLRDALALLEFCHGEAYAGASTMNPLWSEWAGDWLNTETVIGRIRLMHPELDVLWSGRPATSFRIEIIEGNHDTRTPNEYLNLLFSPSPIEERRRKLQELSDSRLALEEDPSAHLQDDDISHYTESRRLVYEHGDACDEYNNDLDFFKMGWDPFPPRGGYFGTRDRIIQELLAPASWWTRRTISRDDILADWSIKAAGGRRARRIFEANPSDVRVIVLGHTHQPCLQSAVELGMDLPRTQIDVRPLVRLTAGERMKDITHRDVDFGTVQVHCIRGAVELTLLTKEWFSEVPQTIKELTLSDGEKSEILTFPEATLNNGVVFPWRQDNILSIYSIRDSVISVDMRSVDR